MSDHIEGENASDDSSIVRLRGLEAEEPVFADFVGVNYDPYTFHLAFSRLEVPIIFSNEERERFAKEGWTASVTSRLVVPASAFRDMVGFMQLRLNEYDRQYGYVTDDSDLTSMREETADE